MDEKQLIVKVKWGSHLYGTSNEFSDEDFKGVYMPTLDDIFLQQVENSIQLGTKREKKEGEKNTSKDIDFEVYSLKKFIDEACEGQTAALDILHAPKNMIIYEHPLWDEIVKRRERFYTKNLNSFVEYCRKQASKYGVKGSRLAVAKQVLEFCDEMRNRSIIGEVKNNLSRFWNDLPEGEHIIKHPPDVNGIRMYEVCNLKVGETASPKYLKSVIQKFYDKYGKRARKAEANEGIDWKAISHALRAAYQVKEIMTERTITFPLKEAKFLMEVKEGKYHYKNDIAPMLDQKMDDLEKLVKKSTLPDEVDRGYWNRWPSCN